MPAVLELLVKFRTIDRRIISTLVILVLAGPMLVRVPLKMYPFEGTLTLQRYIDEMDPGKLVLVAADWDAATQGECLPLTAAVMDYLMRLDRPFAIFSFYPQGPTLAQEAAEELAKKHGKKYGEDWVNWGYQPDPVTALIAMMNSIPAQIKKDTIEGRSLASFPVMQGVRNLTDLGLIYEVTGSSLLDAYLQFCAGVPLANGCTAVVGPEQYPYLQSKQIIGLLVGLGGAAQFEIATDFKDEQGNVGGQGLRGMGSQSLAHLLLMALIVLGNLGVWAAKKLGVETRGVMDLPDEAPEEGDQP